MPQPTTTERPGPERPRHPGVRRPPPNPANRCLQGQQFLMEETTKLHCRKRKTAVQETKTALQFFVPNGTRSTQKLQTTPANGVVEVKTAVQEKKLHCSECVLNTFAQASRTRFQHARRTAGTEQQHRPGPATNTGPGQPPNPVRAPPRQPQNNLESQKCSIL